MEASMTGGLGSLMELADGLGLHVEVVLLGVLNRQSVEDILVIPEVLCPHLVDVPAVA